MKERFPEHVSVSGEPFFVWLPPFQRADAPCTRTSSPRTNTRPGAAPCFMMKRRKSGSGYQYRGNAEQVAMEATPRENMTLLGLTPMASTVWASRGARIPKTTTGLWMNWLSRIATST